MNEAIPLSFFYIIFQANPDRERVFFWVDGKKTKQVISRDIFLQMASQIGGGSLYPKIYDATHTFSFYMWNAVDSVLIHLTQKIEGQDNFDYKNSLCFSRKEL